MKKNFRFVALIGLVFVAAFSRLLPHLPNFTPMTAVFLFGAAHFSRRGWALGIPLVALFLTDLVLNNTILRSFYPDQVGTIWFSNEWSYIAFALIGLMGWATLRTASLKTENVLGTSLAATLLFYFISNTAVWAQNPAFYAPNFGGWVACMWAGVPFLGYSMLGDLFYTGIIFGGFEWAKSRWTQLQSA